MTTHPPQESQLVYPNAEFEQHQGVGMTSQRTRNRLITRLIELGVTDQAVLQVMRVVPRHLFLDEAMSSRSYEDTALPIGYGQTISQPWVVGKMTQWLFANVAQNPISTVLEIGTGSGYQTAILALLAKTVFTVERITPLSERAQRTLTQLALENVQYAISDGHWGWPNEQAEVTLTSAFGGVFSRTHSPQPPQFDAIISAASPAELPPELLQQLKFGGRLVIPLGETKQLLFGFEKTAEGIIKTCLGEVMFVPMKQGIEI